MWGGCGEKRAGVVGRGNRGRWGLQHHPGCQVIVLFMVLNVREAGRKVWGECGRNEECGVIEKGRVGAGLFLVHFQQQASPCPHAQPHRLPHTFHTVHTLQVEMTCLVPDAGNDMVMVLVLGKRGSLPVLQAQLRMPISEPEEA